MSDLPLVRVWSIDLDDPRWLLLDQRVWLDGQEQARAARFVRAQDASRYMASHVAMRWIIAREYGYQPDEITYQYNPWGKPALAGGPEFSLSHSAGRALLAMAEHQLGIDIEIGTRSVHADWFEPVWSRAEKARLGAASLSNAHLLAIWRRKEAVVKALGKGLSQPLADVVVPLAQDIGPDGRWSLARTHEGLHAFHCREMAFQGEIGCIATTTVSRVEVQLSF
nr:4'-phosphopantetheinyl transferase superfamily protein [uncultured Shinella sp.]